MKDKLNKTKLPKSKMKLSKKTLEKNPNELRQKNNEILDDLILGINNWIYK